jgi:hypothetical protein
MRWLVFMSADQEHFIRLDQCRAILALGANLTITFSNGDTANHGRVIAVRVCDQPYFRAYSDVVYMFQT